MNLSAGLAIFRIKVAEGLQYRVAFFANSSIGFFWGLIEVTVYRVFFIHAGSPAILNTTAFTLPQMVSYIWMMQILLALTPHNVEADILGKIDSGDIGLELCRPLDLYLHWFAKTAAGRIAPLLFRGIPILLISVLLPSGWRLGPPDSLAGLLLMIVSCVLSLFLCASYTMLVTAVRMNVTWGDGPMQMILLIGMVFSGAYLPLQLWPDVMQKALLYQPFAGYLDIPLRFYVGTMTGADAAFAFGLQGFWTLVFIVAGKALMSARLKRTIVQGG
jgi:ABC-2 type transport system permease protein